MRQPDTTVIMRKTDRLVRIILPNGIGMIEITTGLYTGDSPRVRVDVVSDQPRYGAVAQDGLRYVVENGDPGPGVVFLTGEQP